MTSLRSPSSGACPQASRPRRGGDPRGHIRGAGLPGARTGQGADSDAQGGWAATARNWPRSKLGRQGRTRDAACEQSEPPTPATQCREAPGRSSPASARGGRWRPLPGARSPPRLAPPPRLKVPCAGFAALAGCVATSPRDGGLQGLLVCENL